MSMQDAVTAVRRLARKRQLGSFAIKLRSPIDQLLDTLRTFFHQDVRCFDVHESVTGVNRVLQVQADFIFVAQCDGDSTLGILRGRFSQFLLGQHQHFAGFSQSNGRAQPRNACADNYEVHL